MKRAMLELLELGPDGPECCESLRQGPVVCVIKCLFVYQRTLSQM